ncbi:MAG: DUF6702 family protein [Planctomycetota bacterium]
MLLGLSLLLCSAAVWHPVHTTMAEVDWNSEAQTLEIALHLTPRDLETALTSHGGKPVRLDKAKDLDTLIEAWLKDRLQLQDEKNVQATLTWVGKELDLRDVWIYFQFEGVSTLKDWELHNTLLASVAEDYVATVQLRVPEQEPRSLRFDSTTTKRALLTDQS